MTTRPTNHGQIDSVMIVAENQCPVDKPTWLENFNAQYPCSGHENYSKQQCGKYISCFTTGTDLYSNKQYFNLIKVISSPVLSKSPCHTKVLSCWSVKDKLWRWVYLSNFSSHMSKILVNITSAVIWIFVQQHCCLSLISLILLVI